MSNHECVVCNNIYRKPDYRPIMLSCGDTICSSCINSYKEALKKDEFECPKCCNISKSLNIENKQAYPKDNAQIQQNNNQIPIEGEFEIFIRPKNAQEKYSIKVTKKMTIAQLKEKIETEKGINPRNFQLAFKKPLTDLKKTLEEYKIVKTVTLTQISIVEGGNKAILFRHLFPLFK